MPPKVRGPSVPMPSLPGSLRASATSSASDRTGRSGCAARDDHERRAADHAHRHEVLVRIVGQRLERVGVDHQRCGGRVEERVAVGRRARRGQRTDHVLSARTVVDDHRLAPVARQALGEQSRDDVRTRSGRLRQDQAHRALRPVLRGRGRGGQRGQQGQSGQRSGGPVRDTAHRSSSSRVSSRRSSDAQSVATP